jgi:hypothetical protein
MVTTSVTTFDHRALPIVQAEQCFEKGKKRHPEVCLDTIFIVG